MDYRPLIEQWQGGDLDRWAQLLPEQLETGLSHKRYGDLARWMDVLNSLPDIVPDQITLDSARVGASCNQPLPSSALESLHATTNGATSLAQGAVRLIWRSH